MNNKLKWSLKAFHPGESLQIDICLNQPNVTYRTMKNKAQKK